MEVKESAVINFLLVLGICQPMPNLLVPLDI